MTEESGRQSIWLRHLSLREAVAITIGVLTVVILLILFYPRTAPQVLARRVVCASTLRSVGMGVALYQADHGGLDPVEWGELLGDDYSEPELLVCPSSGTVVAAGATPADLEGHVDYVLVSGMGEEEDSPSDLIRAFELPGSHEGNGPNVVHVDGAVFYTDDSSKLMRQLQQVNDHLAKLRRGTP